MLAKLLAVPGVTETLVLGGPVGVLALHGGIEAGTANMARRVAEPTGATLYSITQPDDLAWHVPSIHHDPMSSDRLRAFLRHVRLAVSVHGFGRPGLRGAVLLGGTNRRVAGAVAAALRRLAGVKVIDRPDRMPPGLKGLHPANPVNLPELGGVQLELSREARQGRVAQRIAEAVAEVVASESKNLSAAPRP